MLPTLGVMHSWVLDCEVTCISYSWDQKFEKPKLGHTRQRRLNAEVHSLFLERKDKMTRL